MNASAGDAAPGPLPGYIGRYRVVDRIGRGAMGVVYAAVDEQLGRRVAVKLMLGDFDQDPQLRARFQREARVTGQLAHRNIVTVFDLGEHDGRPGAPQLRRHHLPVQPGRGRSVSTDPRRDRTPTRARALARDGGRRSLVRRHAGAPAAAVPLISALYGPRRVAGAHGSTGRPGRPRNTAGLQNAEEAAYAAMRDGAKDAPRPAAPGKTEPRG